MDDDELRKKDDETKVADHRDVEKNPVQHERRKRDRGKQKKNDNSEVKGWKNSKEHGHTSRKHDRI